MTLPPPQQKLFDAIAELSEGSGKFVSTKDIVSKAGIENQSAANHALNALVKKGLVRKYKKLAQCEWKLK